MLTRGYVVKLAVDQHVAVYVAEGLAKSGLLSLGINVKPVDFSLGIR
jgi:hypothetical protein